MTGILAIDTSTDACSVALYRDGAIVEHSEVAPRRHNQLLFDMLKNLLPRGSLRDEGVEYIAYGCGPGSFTGLRIAASAVQGLAYANQLPAIPVSTLGSLAQSAYRRRVIAQSDRVLTLLDAKIKELYWAYYEISDGLATLFQGPGACKPWEVPPAAQEVSCAVGDGCELFSEFQDAPAFDLNPGLRPMAQDLIPLALDKLSRGETERAQQVSPVYVRDEISWKKVAQQGQKM